MDLYLKHTPQPWPWGCQYYSLYSLVGNDSLLADVTEANSIRFDERARELGYYLSYVYSDCTCTAYMPEAAWQKALGGTDGVAALQGNVGAFLIGLPSPKNRRIMHTVGIAMRAVSDSELAVQVFDPAAAGEKEYATLADFLASPYGKVYDLKQVLPLARLAAELPRAFGPDAAHVRPEVREAYYQSLAEKEAA
jgi:hypothetical protein